MQIKMVYTGWVKKVFLFFRYARLNVVAKYTHLILHS